MCSREFLLVFGKQERSTQLTNISTRSRRGISVVEEWDSTRIVLDVCVGNVRELVLVAATCERGVPAGQTGRTARVCYLLAMAHQHARHRGALCRSCTAASRSPDCTAHSAHLTRHYWLTFLTHSLHHSLLAPICLGLSCASLTSHFLLLYFRDNFLNFS